MVHDHDGLLFLVQILAVRKINSLAIPEQSGEEFLQIVSNVSRLHHPNVTELAGYCSKFGQHLLVYREGQRPTEGPKTGPNRDRRSRKMGGTSLGPSSVRSILLLRSWTEELSSLNLSPQSSFPLSLI